MTAVFYCGDARTVLATLPAESVRCCVTSPPYWRQRDYGHVGQLGLEASPAEYVEKMVAVFEEVRRVLTDDGTLWLVIGDSYAGSGQGFGDTKTTNKRNGASRGVRIGSVHGESGHTSGVKPPPGLKAKDLVGIPWALAFALRDAGWWLRSDIIWCLSGGAKVYARTQKGDMSMSIKDLVRLNPATVKLWNGKKWTQVLGWSRSPDPRD